MTRLFAAALAAATLAACSGSPAADDARREDSESFVAAADGKLLHYRKRGVGPRVLLVPGGSWMDRDLEPLSDDRLVISYDLRGRGQSDPVAPKSPPTLAQDLADMEAVVAWFGLERFSVLAMDYAAAVAAHYAARHPEQVDRLVLASPMPIRKNPYAAIYARVFSGRLDSQDFVELRELARLLVPRRDPQRWAQAYKEALFTGWVADPASLERMRSSPFVEPNSDPEAMILQYEAVRRGLGDWDFRAELSAVRCAALVVYGAADPVPEQSSLEWASALPAGAPQRIEASGRLPWVEEPRAFFAAVRAFLDAGV